jgi:hypothetical protein
MEGFDKVITPSTYWNLREEAARHHLCQPEAAWRRPGEGAIDAVA